jgi:hypothetical protein
MDWFEYYPGICPEGFRNITNNLTHDSGMAFEFDSSEYEARVIIIRQPLLVLSFAAMTPQCLATIKEYCILFIHSFFYSFIHSSMALQTFVGPWPLLQFRNLFHTDGGAPWTSGQPVARPLPTQRTTQTEK